MLLSALSFALFLSLGSGSLALTAGLAFGVCLLLWYQSGALESHPEQQASTVIALLGKRARRLVVERR